MRTRNRIDEKNFLSRRISRAHRKRKRRNFEWYDETSKNEERVMLQAAKDQAVEPRSWQEIDAALRAIAKRRCELDAEESLLLSSAVRREIWRHFGRASLLEYLEEVLGYTPKTARERVRVALALDELPELAEALETGEQSYSAIRELTRVAMPETEAEWRAAARDKNVRSIEELVAVHRRGDRPSDPPNPDLKPRVVRFEISTATLARLRQVQQVLADEHGGQLDDDALVGILCDAVLDGPADGDQGRSKFQIRTTICTSCKQGWQQGGNLSLAISHAQVAVAECDAQRIGADHRAAQDIPPRIRRLVLHRDGRRCQVPGCRSARHVEVHHIEPVAGGGSHDESNLTLLCDGHHVSHHKGHLAISGRAPDALTFKWIAPTAGHATERHDDNLNTAIEPIPVSQVGRPPHEQRASNYARVVIKTEATQALTQAGFPRAIARRLVEEAADAASAEVTLVDLVRDALKLSRGT